MSEFRLNPRYKEAISNVVNQSPYFSLLSMKIMDLEWGTSVLEVQLEEKHLQPFGYVHGGAIASVMDAATFWAVFPQVQDGMGLTTVEIKVNFLAPVQKGKLVGKGRCIKIGKTLALGDATIYDVKGNILGHGTATMMIVPDLKVEGQENLPSKLL
ncbi:MAG: thioesterase [Deltaproteobacteria bacterium RBG_19FT_COMBO_46_12]|nr:MAG: thioesterase [Deltaproteobacteria bacterium RBG_19FT_COMBO_46_12]